MILLSFKLFSEVIWGQTSHYCGVSSKSSVPFCPSGHDGTGRNRLSNSRTFLSHVPSWILKYGFHNKTFFLNAPLVSCQIPVIRFGWVCCCIHPERMTGNGQLTSCAFRIIYLLWNPYICIISCPSILSFCPCIFWFLGSGLFGFWEDRSSRVFLQCQINFKLID